jgi:general secretion pathway protein A
MHRALSIKSAFSYPWTWISIDVHGDPGSGKSVVMRLLAERLARLADLSVAVIHHPQSSLSDFYRELGDIFSISMRVSNRWGGFKALRARWIDHLGSASRRPVVLIDERKR